MMTLNVLWMIIDPIFFCSFHEGWRLAVRRLGVFLPGGSNYVVCFDPLCRDTGSTSATFASRR